MPFGLCARLDVVDIEGLVPILRWTSKFTRKTVEEQSGWRSLGAQGNGGSRVIVEDFYGPFEG